jgi:two-component system sensor histidine kinase MprB
VNFTRRVTIAAAAAVAVAVVLASLLTYVLVRDQLRGGIDNALRGRANAFVRLADAARTTPPGRELATGARLPPTTNLPRRRERDGSARTPVPTLVVETSGGPVGVPSPLASFYRPIPVPPGEARPFGQIVTGSGPAVSLPSSVVVLPVQTQTRAVARAGKGSALFDATVHGQHLRILTQGLAPGTAIEIARPLAEVDSVLSNVRLILALLTAGGIALAAVLGRFVAGAVVAPVRRLTDTAEHVAQTQDLGRRIDDVRRDELGRLAHSFNAMLDALQRTVKALDDSARAQRQLVADASHELRTPVASVRTNIEILQRAESMAPAERDKLMSDVVEQLEELSALVGDLIELARDEEAPLATEEVRLDTLVEEAITRSRRHAPQARFTASLAPTVVNGVPARLDRAVNNLLDNAVKFGGGDGQIEVQLSDGELTIRDHGPGMDPQEAPHVFDRFYRGGRARALPGSGLGLAIVRQVAETHGGSVTLDPASGGGTIARLRLPVL